MPSSGSALPAALSAERRCVSDMDWTWSLFLPCFDLVLLTCDTECSASTCTRDKSVPEVRLEPADGVTSSPTDSAKGRRAAERNRRGRRLLPARTRRHGAAPSSFARATSQTSKNPSTAHAHRGRPCTLPSGLPP